MQLDSATARLLAVSRAAHQAAHKEEERDRQVPVMSYHNFTQRYEALKYNRYITVKCKPIMLGLKPDPPKEERLRKTASASFNIVDRICMTFPDS